LSKKENEKFLYVKVNYAWFLSEIRSQYSFWRLSFFLVTNKEVAEHRLSGVADSCLSSSAPVLWFFPEGCPVYLIFLLA